MPSHSSNSSSSSSESSSSSSSSSMGCPCTSFLCNGPACTNLTGWTVYGANVDNTDNCALYIVCDNFGGNQQVEFYKDSLYSELVAIAQGAAGSLLIQERNSSGISGSVLWDGNIVSYPSESIISCYEFSSSSSHSSNSSIDSTSTSSQSRSSASSSSNHCCTNPDCEGAGCSHFSAWTITGSDHENTSNCTIYVAFEYIASNQQIRLYKGSSYTDLVAAGQANGAGAITLTQRNSSGLSGTVDWDGIPVNFPSFAILDCDVSSSSSFSSSSSSSQSLSSSSYSSSSSTTSHSTSSQSSSSSSSSSISSISSISSSSTSTSSSSTSSSSISSSSSSINSVSSSSESEGNVSTSSSSSSSSVGGWNKSKPLLLATSAISSIGTKRLSQTVYIESDTYDIGKVYCYFYGPYGFNTSYTIYLGIYTCNDDGSPLNSVFSGTLSGSSITGNGWYSFTVGIGGTTPNNHYLSFVVWQQGGNEDDYVLWGYSSTTDTVRTSAWASNDGLVWQEQDEIIRALKVTGSFDAYDLTNFRILTPPAELEVITQDFTGGIYDQTKLVRGSYEYGADKVVIDYPNAIVSFVIDSSGSMGWNDRANSRSEMVTAMIQRFKDHYPSDVVFDIVKFGALSVNANSITLTGTPQYINLDLNNATRIPFVFSVTGAVAAQDAVYSNNSHSFTVTEDLVFSGSSLICISDGSADPYPSGTLTKISGTGDISIEYDSFSISSYADGIVSIGFKNLVDDHPYNIGEIIVGGTYNQEVALSNWRALSPNGETEFSIGNHGPNGTSSLDLIGDPAVVLRRPATVVPLNTSKIISDAAVGSTTLYIENVSLFSSGNKIDFVDVDSCSLGHTISNVNSVSSSIVVSPPITARISSWINGGGIAQDSNFDFPANITGTTIQLMIRDRLTSLGEISTFFVQTIDGMTIEWDFKPFDEWVTYNLFWLGDTALLSVSLYDTDGNPLPDGLEVQFSADKFPEDTSLSKQKIAVYLSEDASIGNTIIYVQSTQGYVKDLEIDILNNNNEMQTVLITEVGENVTGKYIRFTPALLYNFNISDNAKIIKSVTSQDQTNASSTISSSSLLSDAVGLVDVTPIVTGKNLDPSLLQPYDLTPVTPSTTYGELNLDVGRIQTITIDVPTIDGEADVRILPITEDNPKTVAEKSKENARLIYPERPPDYSDQLEQNSEDGLVTTTSSTTSTTTLLPSPEKDYVLESPVYSQNGLAESSMISYATNLSAKTFDISVPGLNNSASIETTLMVKTYNIYTALVSNDSRGNPVARLYFKPFEVDFTPPVFINSSPLSGEIEYTIETENTSECYTPKKSYHLAAINGAYVGNEYQIEYTITDENVLLQNGELNIRIYSNSLVNIESVLKEGTESRQELNAIYPARNTNVNSVITSVEPLSNIDKWRQFVENNPIGQIIETPQSPEEIDGAYEDVARKYADLVGGHISEELSSGARSIYYLNPEQWTWAAQYPSTVYNQVISINDGKATLTIPSSEVSALLLVQASVYFGDNNQFEMIRSDFIYNGNPIDIGEIDPGEIYAEGGDVVYEIGTKITWEGSAIADNVTVSFAPHDLASYTPMLPSVSKTDIGWAGGVNIGPHEIVEMICAENSDCPCYGEAEEVDITVSYLGYQRTTTRSIYWTGPIPQTDEDDNVFYFYVPE